MIFNFYGCPAAGKSALGRMLREDNAVVIDDYYPRRKDVDLRLEANKARGKGRNLVVISYEKIKELALLGEDVSYVEFTRGDQND